MTGPATAGGTPGGDLQAHGLGGVQDLPIPLEYAVAGAVAALVVSFVVLALAWRRPRYEARQVALAERSAVPAGVTVGGGPAPTASGVLSDGSDTGRAPVDPPHRGRPAPEPLRRLVAHPAFAVALRVLGMVLFLYTVAVAVFGVDKVINPFFGIFYVWLWVGIVPLSLFFGPFYKAISPVRTINLLFAKLAGTSPDEGLRAWPARLGYWPAAFGLVAFVWIELVYPHSTELSPVRLWCAVYVAVMLVGGAVFGSTFYEHADPFEVYSTLVGKLSIWTVHDGALRVLSPLANLATVRIAPGLVGVVGVLFGSTAFDSFGESPTWVRFLQGTELDGYLLTNVTLVAFCVAATGIFCLGAVATPVAPGFRRRLLPDLLAHSVVPIIVGYIVAHYLTLLVEVGSRTLILASDPFSTGADYLGTGDWAAVTWLSYHPTLLAVLKVAGVVIGHVVAAVAAHDRALAVLPPQHALVGQLPMLLVMVGFTAGGLFLLFSS